MFRNDVSDISIEELKNLDDREVLLEEHKHINNQIREKDSGSYKIIIFFFGVIVVFIGSSISSVIDTLHKMLLNSEKYTKEDLQEGLPFIFDLALYAATFIVILFTIIVILDLFNRGKLIKRKLIVLTLLNNLDEKNKKDNI